jgi:hypothetical protein
MPLTGLLKDEACNNGRMDCMIPTMYLNVGYLVD